VLLGQIHPAPAGERDVLLWPQLAERLQAPDHGSPIVTSTVAAELGHKDVAVAEPVYRHLGKARHRAEVVEYRVVQHAAYIPEKLGAGETTSVTPNPAAAVRSFQVVVLYNLRP
jgi:hypothetical protein